jgi:hypothetical protein
MNYEATHLRSRIWAIRPEGALGTMGWVGGQYWEVAFVTADNADDAMRRWRRRRRRIDLCLTPDLAAAVLRALCITEPKVGEFARLLKRKLARANAGRD